MFLRAIFLLLLNTGLAQACATALVISLDVSKSVDKHEYVLMRNGIARALIEDDVIALLTSAPGGTLITVAQWASTGQQNQYIPWRHINVAGDVIGLAENLAQMPRDYVWTDTSQSEALLHAALLLDHAPQECARKIIDLSTDGISNAGPPPDAIATSLGRRGITINGLIVTGHKPDPVRYFRQHIRSGPLAFVEQANSYDSYFHAMRRKLLRELRPVISAAPPADLFAKPG